MSFQHPTLPVFCLKGIHLENKKKSSSVIKNTISGVNSHDHLKSCQSQQMLSHFNPFKNKFNALWLCTIRLFAWLEASKKLLRLEEYPILQIKEAINYCY